MRVILWAVLVAGCASGPSENDRRDAYEQAITTVIHGVNAEVEVGVTPADELHVVASPSTCDALLPAVIAATPKPPAKQVIKCGVAGSPARWRAVEHRGRLTAWQ